LSAYSLASYAPKNKLATLLLRLFQDVVLPIPPAQFTLAQYFFGLAALPGGRAAAG
jgi:hypothetical protein